MKNKQDTQNKYMSATITAHADEEARLLMVEITAAEQPPEPQHPLAKIFNEQKPLPEDLHIR